MSDILIYEYTRARAMSDEARRTAWAAAWTSRGGGSTRREPRPAPPRRERGARRRCGGRRRRYECGGRRPHGAGEAPGVPSRAELTMAGGRNPSRRSLTDFSSKPRRGSRPWLNPFGRVRRAAVSQKLTSWRRHRGTLPQQASKARRPRPADPTLITSFIFSPPTKQPRSDRFIRTGSATS